ncbi:MAG: ATP-dependent helicase [Deltaproteobacteria bacterium]|nr:ATP-dependent helicase [Deltaproteobacteria bacterium]
MIDLSGLNENQKYAVNWGEGSLLVLAGPGSGKTKVLTLRVAKIISETPQDNFRILGLTFTNKAATEMRERIDKVLGSIGNKRANLCTFHSFCTEILRQYGGFIGLKPDFQIVTQDLDREQLFNDVIKSIRIDENDISDKQIGLLKVVDRLIANSVSDSEIFKWVNKPEIEEKVRRLYSGYTERLLKENKVDFPTIIFFTEKLLREKTQVCKQIQTVYPYVCVDEFQDTNFSQYKVLKYLINDRLPNLFVVADDDQIIYEWNGANPQRLEELIKDYKMEVIQLPANYRCPPKVIELANSLIQNNRDRAVGKKPLVAMKTELSSGDVSLKKFESFEDEISWLVQDIKNRGSSEYSECAVLSRTSKLLEAAAVELNKKQIPAHVVLRKSDFESGPLQWLDSMLRLASSRSDKIQLRRLCRAFFKLEGVDIPADKIISQAVVNGDDYLRAWFEISSKENSIEEITKKFLDVVRKPLLDHNQFIFFIEEAFKWADQIEKASGGAKEEVFSSYVEEASLWKKLQQEIENKIGLDDLTLHAFLQELDLTPKTPAIPENAVRCLTIHSSKGMEFSHVYLIGMVEDQIPSFQSVKEGDGSKEMQEERRNCFVAITRTQDTLSLSYAKKYFGWQKKPSRFLCEMGLLDE